MDPQHCCKVSVLVSENSLQRSREGSHLRNCLLRAGDKLAARMVMRSDSQFAQSARLAELDEKVSVTLLLFWGVWQWVTGSGMFIRDPEFFHLGSQSPDSRSNKKRREKKKLVDLHI